MTPTSDCREAQMREEFERWCKTKTLDIHPYTNSWTGKVDYQHSRINAMWEGWQAAWSAKPDMADRLAEALEKSHNHLKYQYETDKQKIMRMVNLNDQNAALCGLNILASVLKRNEQALAQHQAAKEGR